MPRLYFKTEHPVFCYESAAAVKRSKMAAPNLDTLEEILGYRFGDRSLLERALTHRSWAHEQVPPGAEEQARRLHNEALEFIGDSVLGLTVAAYLFQSHTDVTEGELSRMKHNLVSEQTLADVSERLSLGDFMRVGRGEGRTIKAAEVSAARLALESMDAGQEEAKAAD